MNKLFKLVLLSKDKLLFELKKSSGAAEAPVTAEQIAAVLDSFGSLGYTLDVPSICKLAQSNLPSLKSFYNQTYILLNNAKGGNVEHKIFYPNFPDMKGISPDEYVLRAVLHYITVDENDYGFANHDIAAHEAKNIDNDKKIVLSLVDKKQADSILLQVANDALTQKLPIPESKQDAYIELWRHYSDRIAPEEIPYKENLALYVYAIKEGEDVDSNIIPYEKLSFCKTVTDVLRVYAALSDADVQLAERIWFYPLPRVTRRAFLHKIDDLCHTTNVAEDFLRHEFLWKRATELLHPYDYRKQYPLAFDYICMLRSGKLGQTFESRLNASLADEYSYLLLLRTRPTEYARRLDFMLRTFKDTEMVLGMFKDIVDGVSVNVLHALWNYYLNRTELGEFRDFVFYNGRTKTAEVEENRPEMSAELCDKVLSLIKDELSKRFASYPQKGKLYIADGMQNYTLPISSRSASRQIHTLNYGTKLSVDDGEKADFVRLFTHWHNSDERIDIDLSVELIAENMYDAVSLSWHNMSGGVMFDSYHSGDLTTAPDGASEFVDLNIAEARKFGRYALVCNYCYTEQLFCDIPECFSGVMFMPQRAKEGEVFNPQFVKFKFDLSQRANSNIAFALDLETRELIWMDTSMLQSNSSPCVAAGDYGKIIALRRVLQKRASVYEWMKLHASHLQLADNREEADYVVDVTDNANVDPTDTENFVSKWM